MSHFELEQGVPIPPPVGRAATKNYPFPDMKIGDSFFVPSEDPAKDAVRVRSAAKYFMKRANGDHMCPEIALVVRIVPGGVRVWRTN